MSTVGDTMPCNLSTVGDIMSTVGGFQYRRGVQYRGGTEKQKFPLPHGTHDIPHGTKHPPRHS